MEIASPLTIELHFAKPALRQVLQEMLDLNLDWKAYPLEPLPVNGSTRHTPERLLPYVTHKKAVR